MFKNLRIGQKLILSLLAVPVLVGVFGWYLVSVVGDTGLAVSDEFAPHVNAMMEIKLAVTTAHLNLEELMAGDTTRSIDEIRALLDSADWHAQAVIDGAADSDNTYVATTDDRLRERVVSLRNALQVLRRATEARHAQLAAGTAGIGSNADQAFDAAFDGFIRVADGAETRAQSLLNEGSIRVRRIQSDAQRNMMIGAVLAIALAVGIAAFMARHLSEPLVAAAGLSRRLAAGDLTGTSSTSAAQRSDEVGQLVGSFDAMRNSLRSAMSDIQTGARELATQSQEVGATAAEYATTAAEQARSVHEASTTVEELRQLSDSAMGIARQVVEGSKQAVDHGHRGMEVTSAAVASMDVVGARVDLIAQSIRELSDRNDRIREVVDTVNDLAEQSNLLAVNASIEAAQAGEHGRGFAVVASEVRNLATQSKRAAQQIRTLLVEIERATAASVGASQEGLQRTAEGKELIRAARDVIEELGRALEESSERAKRIAGSAHDQALATSQVAAALRDISGSGQMQLAGVVNLENAAAKLLRLSETQRSLADRYVL